MENEGLDFLIDSNPPNADQEGFEAPNIIDEYPNAEQGGLKVCQ